MAAMVASGSSSSGGGSNPVLVQDKGSRNKRKFRSDPPLVDLNKTPSASLAECSSFEFSAEKSQNSSSHEQHDFCDLCGLSRDQLDIMIKPDFRLACGPGSFDQSKEVAEFQDADWSDYTENQLEDIVIKNLDTIYKSAIKKIVACGYDEEVASKAVLRSGLCYGYKDPATNIVENTLAFLRNGHEFHSSRDHFFENLEQLEKYVLVEMVCVLREVRPFFSVGDAMWCLLICDMNMSQACALDGDLSSTFNSDASPATFKLTAEAKRCEANLNSLPTASGSSTSSNPKNSPVNEGGTFPVKRNPTPKQDNCDKSLPSQTIRRSPTPEERPVGGRKPPHSIAAKRESILRQKSLHLEKTYKAYGAKTSLRQGKLGNLGGLILDKNNKAASVDDMKSACLKSTKTMGVDTNTVLATPVAAMSNFETISTQPSLSQIDTKLSLSQPSETTTTVPKQYDENVSAGMIPFGESVAGDKKDELILKLAPRVKELQNQLQGWTDWANQKVMQAARRLSKDKSELKTLRVEKEEMARLKKEKQSLEENTMKKLSEMETALCKASGQVERANSAVRRLESENSRLRTQMEESKLRAAESAASCLEVMRREKKTMHKFQSWEKQKTFYQEELATEKRKLAQLQQELEIEKARRDQLEARRKQEEDAKEEYLVQAKSITKEREQIESCIKAKEDLIRMKAENDLLKYKDDMRKLEADISQLRLKTDSSKIAALRWGNDGSYAGCVMDAKNRSGFKHNSYINTTAVGFQDYLGTGNLKRERECVMCLTEEMSVVFLPCAHQVVCVKCNELHDKQGMKDCPSCRTPIQRRICVRYASS